MCAVHSGSQAWSSVALTSAFDCYFGLKLDAVPASCSGGGSSGPSVILDHGMFWSFLGEASAGGCLHHLWWIQLAALCSS